MVYGFWVRISNNACKVDIMEKEFMIRVMPMGGMKYDWYLLNDIDFIYDFHLFALAITNELIHNIHKNGQYGEANYLSESIDQDNLVTEKLVYLANKIIEQRDLIKNEIHPLT